MTQVIDIRVLREQFKEKTQAADLQEFATIQQDLIEKLLLENKKQQEKITHLEKVLDSVVMQTTLSGPVSPEEMICIEQINILHERSSARELTLDDVKRLDILVKNLRLIREMSTQVIDTTAHANVEEVDLVRIATAKQTDDQ